MIRTLVFTCLMVMVSVTVVAQDDVKSLHQTARSFMMAGDYDNAIIVLKRALAQEQKNLELNKDLVQAYFLKRDFARAKDGAEALMDRNDADLISFQIAGNVYKALEEVKEAEKVYRSGLKKFPKAGPLYSEYGELLWAKRDYTAIDVWEKGIETDPAYSGNYYNAALYYFYTRDKVWSIIYGEIFVNMESLTERGTAMKELLLRSYKEKLFSDAVISSDADENKSAFAKAFLDCMNRQSSLISRGVTTESLIMLRTRFILDWFDRYAAKFPYKLFDYHQQLLKEGMFEAYNQWLFAPVENLTAFDTWTRTHSDEYAVFTNFQKSRVFKMPAGQYYQR